MSKASRIDVRIDAHIKDEFLELAKLRGTSASRLIQEFINSEVSGLPRERRRAGQTAPVQTDDFLN